MSFVDFKQDLQEYLSPVESLGVEIHIITKVYVTLNIRPTEFKFKNSSLHQASVKYGLNTTKTLDIKVDLFELFIAD